MNSNSMATLMMNKRSVVDRVRVPLKQSSPSSMSAVIPNRQVNSVHDCCYTKFLLQNHSNFKRSGPPGRFMYYEDGSWSDFGGEVVDSLRSGFVTGNAVLEVGIGGVRYLFDLYRMLQVDLESGNQRSVAWIDVHGKCFFPKSFIDGGDEFEIAHVDPNIEVVNVSRNPNVEISNVTEDFASETPKIEIEIRVVGIPSSTKRKKGSLETRSEEDDIEKSEGCSSNGLPSGAKKLRLTTNDAESPRWPKAKLMGEGEKAYSFVKSLFLSGIGIVEPGATITSMHHCTRSGPLDRARYEVFQKQLEITKAARGEAKMTFAWHGTSARDVASTLSHGFAMPSKVSGSGAHGVGLYLSPVRSPHFSAMLSEVDDNGEKHVILCRVILGKCEKVEAGSQQLYPSSVDFDTGVDDLDNPKWYVVWCANMNTHILPECVVSYKSSDPVPGQNRVSSFVQSVPGSSTALFAKLSSKLASFLPSSRIQEFRTLCNDYKDGNVAKDSFMNQLRSIVGDEILASAIREVRG